MSVEHYSPGLAFTRYVIARAKSAFAIAAGDPIRPAGLIDYAVKRWGQSSSAVTLLKSAIAGGGTGAGEWGAELADVNVEAATFLDPIWSRTLPGRMEGLRRVPPYTPIVTATDGATAYWVGEGKATPLSRSAFERQTLKPLKSVAMHVVSRELVESTHPAAEGLIQRGLGNAVLDLTNRSFIDPDNAGVANASPASIAYGAPTLPSTGDLADDCEAAIGMLDGAIETAAWAMHPRLAASIGLRAGGRGVAADLGARGGSLAGLPVLTSEAVPFDSDGGSIVLVDAAGIVLVDEGLEASVTTEASVEMLDNPTGDGTTPTAATSIVSLFQIDSVGIKLIRRVNWLRARDAGVVVITGAVYPAP